MTTLAHRSPAKTVPSKRKSVKRSKESSDPDLGSSRDEPTKFGRSRRMRLSHAHYTTPSPVESVKASQVSVVIPSPTLQQQRRFAGAVTIRPSANGMSNNFFPTNEEEERVSRATYPAARQDFNIKRQNVPLSFNSKARLVLDLPTAPKYRTLLLQTLKAKLDAIRGPSVNPVVECPKLLAKLADNFVFINEYLYREGVESVGDAWNIGCNCYDGCDRDKCDCLNKEEDSENRIVPYKICDTNPNLIVATQEFLHGRAISLECTSKCKCKNERCWNHVVQNGRTVRLEIFDTGSRGFGM